MKIKKMLKSLTCAIFFILCAIFIFAVNESVVKVFAYSNNTAVNNSDVTYEDKFSEDRVIVTLRNQVSRSYNNFDFSDYGISKVGKIFESKKGKLVSNNSESECDLLCLTLKSPSKENVIKTINELNKLDEVIYAEPDYQLEQNYVPNDYYYGKGEQWGLNGVNGINIEKAWEVTKGKKSVKVGIIDRGIDLNHEDLKNMVNVDLSSTLSGTGNPNDYVDNHGTHIAGIIGAEANNGIGIAGINHNVQLISLKIDFGGDFYLSGLINAVEYAIENDIPILNNSSCYRNVAPSSTALNSALNRYNGLFVNSAGNEGANADLKSRFPMDISLNNVLSVGSLEENGGRADNSNYGEKSVSIYAPGAYIYSTYNNDKYGYMSGTSMAAPHVAGVAALMLSVNPKLTGAQLKTCILEWADTITIKVPGGTQQVKKLNAYQAVRDVANAEKYHHVYLQTSKDSIPEADHSSYLWLKNGEPWPSKIDVPIAPFGYEFPGYYYHAIGSPNMRYQIYTEKGVFNNNNYYFTQSNFDAKEDITLGSYWKPKDFLFCVGYKHFAEDYRSRTFLTPTINYEGSYEYHMDDKNTVNGKEGNFRCWEMTIGNSGEPIEFSTNTMLEFNVKELIDTYVPNYTEYEGQNIYFYAIYDEPPHCIADGSMITLADGTQKTVEELDGSESLLVWNMLTGQYDTATVLFIDSDPLDWYEVINLYFSDGTNVKVISEHAFWDFDLNEYVFLRDDADKYIGHWFNKQSGGGSAWERVQLTDVQITTEYTAAWSPVTNGYLCYYVDGMLSMPGATEGLINIFEVDGETMTYNSESFARDIETYGLFTYDEFAQEYPVSEEIFNAFNGQYLKVALGKGIITCEQLENLIDRYSCYFA